MNAPATDTIRTLAVMALVSVLACSGCGTGGSGGGKAPGSDGEAYRPRSTDRVIDRQEYSDRLYGFWLGTCIANWTGLVTEMDKVGNTGDIRTGDFYTRRDWGGPDQPSIWGEGVPSALSPVIGFVYAGEDSVWGADDDTDIEYIYQELLLKYGVSVLSGEQIREGWLTHMKREEENFLWVSNQRAFDLMQEGMVPPATGDPENNPEYEMIDAQLTTELFGLLAPSRPDVALGMAYLPIRNVARGNSEWISEFYVTMFSLASSFGEEVPLKERIFRMAEEARGCLPEGSYAAAMYDHVLANYESGIPWEQARDSVYYRYQVNRLDGYDIPGRGLYCDGCFAAGINFAASLVSLFWGEGDFIETVKIGTLTGWDSDNPTATWGGLIGFMIGRQGIEQVFGRKFSGRYHIHRTRTGFPGDGIDSFEKMAEKGIRVIDRVVLEEMGGGIDRERNAWHIPEPH